MAKHKKLVARKTVGAKPKRKALWEASSSSSSSSEEEEDNDSDNVEFVSTKRLKTGSPTKKKKTEESSTNSTSTNSTPSPSTSKGYVVERSPSNRARCRACGKFIDRVEGRVGTPYKLAIGTMSFDKHKYYHRKCVPVEDRQNLFPGSPDDTNRSIKAKLQAVDREQMDNQHIIEDERSDLRDNLRKLRIRLFEEQGKKGGSIVMLSLKAVDQIVLSLPSTERKLLNIKGIGPTIVKQYGKAILKAVRRYRDLENIHSDDDDEFDDR